MKKRLLFLLILLIGKISYSQTTGDYQTKATASNWSDLSSWQVYDGAMWVDATEIPTASLATKPAIITITAPAIPGSVFYMDAVTGALTTTTLYINDGVIFQQGVDQSSVTSVSVGSLVVNAGGVYRVPTTNSLSTDQAANDANGGIRTQAFYTQNHLVVAQTNGVINPNPGKFIGSYTFSHTPDANGTLTSYTQQMNGYLGNGIYPPASANVIYSPASGTWAFYGTMSPAPLPITGDYQTKPNAVRWSDVSSWQIYDGSAWIDATVIPTASLATKPAIITIKAPAIAGSTFLLDANMGNMLTTSVYINDGATLQQGEDQSSETFLSLRSLIVNAGGVFTVPTNNLLSTDQAANDANNGFRRHPFFIQEDVVVSESIGTINPNPGKFIGLYTFTHTPDANGTLSSYTQQVRGYLGNANNSQRAAPSANVIYPPVNTTGPYPTQWTFKGSVAAPVPVTTVTTLPLRLISFNANLKLNTANLTWTTDDEAGVSKFEVEKSTDGVNFQTFITTVAKNTKTRNFYSVNDANVTGGNTYYRLKMIDNDGSYVYSNVRAITNDVITFILYPNPTNDVLKLQFPEIKNSGSLTILNTVGQTLTSQKLTDATSNLEVDVRDLNSGTYMIKLDIDGSIYVKQFIKL